MDICQHVQQRLERQSRPAHSCGQGGWPCGTPLEPKKIEAVRACVDGGVSDEHDKKVKSRSGARLIIQTAERIQNDIKSFQKE